MERSSPWFGTSGSRAPQIVMVGESWGEMEEKTEQPFVGPSGKEMFRMLREALPTWHPELLDSALGASSFSDWIYRRNLWLEANAILLTNVVHARPPKNEMWHFFHKAKEASVPPVRGLHPNQLVMDGLLSLYDLLQSTKPLLIIALGNYALWALTNCTGFSTKQESQGRRCPNGIMKWRGSMWYADAAPGSIRSTKLLPLIHPAAILNTWYNRAPTLHDMRERIPMAIRDDWRPSPEPIMWAPPSFEQATGKLKEWTQRCESGERLRLLNDIETFPKQGLITCVGYADSERFAMVIPLVMVNDKKIESYWPEDQEAELTNLQRALLSHPNCLVEGQNYVYDTQWLQDWLGRTPNLDFDSMLAHHLLFPGTPKSLDYLSSLYCKYHWYWKEDSKEWDLKGDLKSHLEYNAMDCLRNFELNTVLRKIIPVMGFSELWEEEKEVAALALRMMNRGTLVNKNHRAYLALELSNAANELAQWFEQVIPQSTMNAGPKAAPWYRSDKQLRQLAEEMNWRLPYNRKTGARTFGKEALPILWEAHPEFRLLFDNLKAYRSLETFQRNFIKAPLDYDGRIRCSFNVAGTETFRWSSSENAYGRGTNLQNIPKGEEE